MNDFNVIKTGSQRMAESMGNENSEYFKVNNTAFADEIKNAAIDKHNDAINETNEKISKYETDLNEAVEKMKNAAGNNFEIKPINNNIIIQPFKVNPFQTIEKKGALWIPNGMAPTYKSNETGEYEEEEAFIHTGYVWDAGPECKYVKEGDVVMWTKPSEMMIPFYKFGLVSVNETRILAVVNEGLTDRFNNLKK